MMGDDMNTILVFFIVLIVILIIWKAVCPRRSTMMVLCLFSPFIKRIRIYGDKWIGYDHEWRFMFLRETIDDRNIIIE